MQSRSSNAKASDMFLKQYHYYSVFNSSSASGKHKERFENLKVLLTTFLENGSGFCPYTGPMPPHIEP